MVKRKSNQVGKPRPGKPGKKLQIDRLIEASTVPGPETSQTKAPLRMVPSKSKRVAVNLPTTSSNTKPRYWFNQERRRPVKPADSTLSPLQTKSDEQYLIRDRREDTWPNIGLIRLPKETTMPRHRRTNSLKGFRFLDLPGEIRNKIYEYAIKAEVFAIDWYGGAQRSKTLTHRLPGRSRVLWPDISLETVMRRKTLRRNPRDEARDDLMKEYYSHASAVSLLLVNRQLHTEAGTVLYSKCTFSFDLMGPLRHFLDHLLPASKQAIRNLGISHHSYNRPMLTKDQRWKDTYDRTWDDLCWRVSDELPSLTNLVLNLNYRHNLICFTDTMDEARYDVFGTEWMIPLWAFQDIGLEQCILRLQSRLHEEPVLAVESRGLRKQILGNKWDEAVECRERNWYGEAIVRPARRNRSKRGNRGQQGGEQAVGIISLDWDGNVTME